MKVVILAGGFGTRISEESTIKPKSLIEIGEKPILWHIMKIYSQYGFNDFIICLGYKGYMIKDYFYNLDIRESDVTFDFTNGTSIIQHKRNVEPWKVTLVDTGVKTMTGGRIKRIQQFIGEDKQFMFTYGDGLGNINIEELLNFHNKIGKIVTVTGVKPKGRFGNMILDGDLVMSFNEKKIENNEWINGGFFVANQEIFNYINGDSTILEKEPLMNLSMENQLGMYRHNGFWQPMDTLKEKMDLESAWNTGNAKWKIWKD